MKNAVMKPQAMNAAMFGMIMPDRKVPNFWTAIRVLLGFFAGVSACASLLPFRLTRAGRVRPTALSTGLVASLDSRPDLGNHNPACEIRKR